MRYSRENRDEKLAAVKTKVIKLEIIDREKESAIRNLVPDVEMVDLSDEAIQHVVPNVEMVDLSDEEIDDHQVLNNRVPDENNEGNLQHNGASAFLGCASAVNSQQTGVINNQQQQQPNDDSAAVAGSLVDVNKQPPNDDLAALAGGSGISKHQPNDNSVAVAGSSDINKQPPNNDLPSVAGGSGIGKHQTNDNTAAVAGSSGLNNRQLNGNSANILGISSEKNESLANVTNTLGQSISSQEDSNPLLTDELAGSLHKFHQDVRND